MAYPGTHELGEITGCGAVAASPRAAIGLHHCNGIVDWEEQEDGILDNAKPSTFRIRIHSEHLGLAAHDITPNNHDNPTRITTNHHGRRDVTAAG